MMAAPTRHGWLLLVLLLAVVDATAAATVGDVCAAVPFKTLTFECSSRCQDGESCLVFNATEESPCKYSEDDISPRGYCVASALSATVGCDVMCFRSPENNSHAFKFNIAFNKPRATQPPRGVQNATQTDALMDLTDDVPYETNQFVHRIGKLHAPQRITSVVISGGRATAGTRGTLVDVEIDPEIFVNASQITSVSLVNTDLSTESDIAALLPRHLLALDLSNTKLTKMPPSTRNLSKVEALTLDKNFLVEFPPSLNLSALRTLRLRENELTKFATVMTSIEQLDLVANKLAVFPFEVLTWNNLHTLHVERNEAMAKVVFSKNQFAKLSSLEAFSMDSVVLDASSCSAAQLQLLPPNRNVSVCVLSEREWREYHTQLVGLVHEGDTSTSTSSSKTTKVILLTVFIGVAALAVAFIWRKRWSRNAKSLDHSASSTISTTDQNFHSNDSQFEKFLVSKASDVAAKYQVNRQLSGSSTGSSPRKRYTLHTDSTLVLHRMRMEHIEDLRVIGSGGFAVVWLVQYLPQNRLLASKRLIKDQVTRQKTLDFVMEIKLNMELNHPNIVQIVGVAWTIETDLQALLEYMPNGDLRAHLESTTQTAWDTQKLQLAIDIVEALVYVHSFSPPLVHRDLKSRNVLLTDDMKAKLCDFGVSRFASMNNTMTTAVGTGKWLAPEVVSGSNSYDERSDVYAFGVVITELDTHRLPYADEMGPHGDQLPEVAVLQMVSNGQLQPTLSTTCPQEIREIALKCLAFDPADRPTTLQVAHWLRTIRQRCLL